MYAIVDIAGQQYKVEKDQKIFVHRLEEKEGSKIDFDKVLLIDNNGKVTVGTPVVKNMVVSASIVSHLKGDKVKVFKKKRRKGYKVLNGHRQYMTEIHIDGIGEGKAKAKEEAKKAPVKKAAPKVEAKAAKKETPKTEAKTTTKKAVAKPKATTKVEAKAETKPKAKAAPKKDAPKAKAKPAAKKPATKAAPKAKKTDKKDSDK